MRRKKIQYKRTTTQSGKLDERFTGLTNRSLSILMAFLLILGYVDIGALTITKSGFRFSIRGPFLWRLSSGLPPYLHDVPEGPGGQAYLKLMALLAYLLLTEQAYINSGSVVASGLVLTVASPLFDWNIIKKILAQTEDSALQRIVQILINLVLGISLITSQNHFSITSVRMDPKYFLLFHVSSLSLQRVRRELPSMLTLPERIPTLKSLNVIIGILLTLQLVRVIHLTIARGGDLGLGVSGELLAMKIKGGKIP